MHHLLCWAGSVAQNASQVGIPTTVDQVFTQFGTTTYTPPADQRLLRVYAMADSATQIVIDTPILRPIGPPQIQPFDTGAEPATLPPINKYDACALNWFLNDPMSILVSRAGAGASVCYCAAWVAPQPQMPVIGPSRSVRATASVTLTTTTWVSGQLTFSQQLPPGRYKIIGMSAQSTGLFAARLILPNQTYRPGCLAQDTAGEYDHEWFRRGAFGDYGEFESWAPPTAEFLGLSAGAQTPVVWLDVVPVNVPTARF